jgi:hypothetical protein
MKRNLLSLLLLVIQVPLWTGCTVMLWDRTTFSTYYHAADPSNLQVYYSEERRDLLVQYDEARETEKAVRRRYYWLEPNVQLTEEGRKPKFCEPGSFDRMQMLSQTPVAMNPTPSGMNGLYVVNKPRDLRFTIYSGTNEINSYILPDYDADQQIALKILLTPPALAADATVAGALLGLYCWIHSSDEDFDSNEHPRRHHRHRKSSQE